MNKPFMTEVEPSVVEQAYATIGAAGPYALGDTVVCVRHGRLGVYVLSQNKSGGALAKGDALTAIDFATATYEQDAVVYSTANSARKGLASVLGNTDAVAATVAEDALVGATMAITVGTGIGQLGLIVGNEAATAATDKLTSYLSQPFGTSLAATDDYIILPCHQMTKTSAALNLVHGVAQIAVTDGYYFFRQVKGYAFAKVTHGAVYGVDGTNATKALSLSSSATSGELAVRVSDGDDFDTQSHLCGYLIHKKTATTGTLCLIWLSDCIGSLV